MIGVNFQPGSQDYSQQQEGSRNGGRPSSGSGVQEAIKVLSLRLPRVLGAQPAASMPLLTSQGSGGNSRIDSIVNQVMSRMPGQMPSTPSANPTMPFEQPRSAVPEWVEPFRQAVRTPRFDFGERERGVPTRAEPSVDRHHPPPPPPVPRPEPEPRPNMQILDQLLGNSGPSRPTPQPRFEQPDFSMPNFDTPLF